MSRNGSNSRETRGDGSSFVRRLGATIKAVIAAAIIAAPATSPTPLPG